MRFMRMLSKLRSLLLLLLALIIGNVERLNAQTIMPISCFINGGSITCGNNTLTPTTGTVTSVSVTTANGVSGSVATATTTPAITLTLGAITPTSVNGNIFTTGTGTLTLGAGKTATISNTLTLTATDGSTLAIGTGGTLGTSAYITLGANVGTWLATPTSANLAAAITNETGSGALVFATTPTLVTPVLGVATGTSLGLGVAAIGKMTIAAPDLATSPALSIRQAADTTYGYDFRNDDGNGILRLDTVNASVTSTNPSITIKRNTGLVGIGTDAPGKQLDVVGSFRASTEVTMLSLTAASGTPSSICQNAATKEITVNAALTCTVSNKMFKHDINSLVDDDADLVLRLDPKSFVYNDDTRERWGFEADQVASIDVKFGDAWSDGKPLSIDQNAILAATVKKIQQLENRIKSIEAKN